MSYKSIQAVLQREHMWGDMPLTVPPAADLIALRERLNAGFQADELDAWLMDVVATVAPAEVDRETLKAVLILDGWYSAPLAHKALETIGLGELAAKWREVDDEAVEEGEEDDDPTS